MAAFDARAFAASISAAMAGLGQSGQDPAVQLLMSAMAMTIQQQADAAQDMQDRIKDLERGTAGRSSSSGARGGLIDTRQLGRIDKFRGLRKEWADWSFSFKAFLGGVERDAVKCLNWGGLDRQDDRRSGVQRRRGRE